MARPHLPASRRLIVHSSVAGAQDWGIAEEVPVEIGFNGSAWTVMMASPADIEDLAIGLAVFGVIVFGALTFLIRADSNATPAPAAA